jgi:hypothetical protein
MVDTLAGDWRVAGIDDTPLNETYGIALSASETELRWDPRCAQHARRYVIEGRSIAFTAGDADPAPCLSGQPATLAEVARALDAATTIEGTPSNGIRIAGGGHSLLLFSQ